MGEDRKLVARCVAGDEDAWRELYETHTPALLGRTAAFLSSRGRPRPCQDEAEEVLADLYAALVADRCALLRTCRGESSLATWLAVAAIRRAQNHLRSEGRERSRRLRIAADRTAGSDPEALLAGLERREALELLARASEGLSARDRLILRLHFLEGLPRAETAKRLRVSVNSVTALAGRAAGRLRSMLQSGDGGSPRA